MFVSPNTEKLPAVPRLGDVAAYTAGEATNTARITRRIEVNPGFFNKFMIFIFPQIKRIIIHYIIIRGIK
jgi:hypothetical protein